MRRSACSRRRTSSTEKKHTANSIIHLAAQAKRRPVSFDVYGFHVVRIGSTRPQYRPRAFRGPNATNYCSRVCFAPGAWRGGRASASPRRHATIQEYMSSSLNAAAANGSPSPSRGRPKPSEPLIAPRPHVGPRALASINTSCTRRAATTPSCAANRRRCGTLAMSNSGNTSPPNSVAQAPQPRAHKSPCKSGVTTCHTHALAPSGRADRSGSLIQSTARGTEAA